jgi:hypothetical protein
MGGACQKFGEMLNTCKILVGKPEGKRPRGWIHLVHDSVQGRVLVEAVLKIRVI